MFNKLSRVDDLEKVHIAKIYKGCWYESKLPKITNCIYSRKTTIINLKINILKRTSCCCYNLKIGSSIIAVIFFLLYFEIMIAACFLLGIGAYWAYHGHELVIGISAVYIIIELIHLLFFSFLIHGTVKVQQRFVQTWLIFTYIFIAIELKVKNTEWENVDGK